jgi:hypothetical protein
VKSKRSIEVETESTVFERGHRRVMVKVEPSGVVSFRLKNTRRSYELSAAALFHMAVKASVAAKEKGKR